MSNKNCKLLIVRCEAELAVLGKLRHLLHHPDFQAARQLQSQSRVAWLGKVLPEGTQQLAALGVVER